MIRMGLRVRLRGTKKFFHAFRPMGGKCLKNILTYLYGIKYNEISICHSYLQKHVSYEKHCR